MSIEKKESDKKTSSVNTFDTQLAAALEAIAFGRPKATPLVVNNTLKGIHSSNAMNQEHNPSRGNSYTGNR